MDHNVIGLVDSGSEHTLAAPGLARAIGVDMSEAFREIDLGLGGEGVRASFMDVTLRLHHPNDTFDDFLEWRAEVGFLHTTPKAAWSVLLGQVGFLDTFTVTMQRQSQALAIESRERFDERFGVVFEEASYPRVPPIL